MTKEKKGQICIRPQCQMCRSDHIRFISPTLLAFLTRSSYLFIMQTTRVRPLPGNCTLDKSDGSFLFVVRTFSIFPNLFRKCHGSLVLSAKYRFMSEPSTFFNKSHILIWLPRVRDCPPFPWRDIGRNAMSGTQKGSFLFSQIARSQFRYRSFLS